MSAGWLPTGGSRPSLRVSAAFLLAALPWLNPFSSGPSPAVMPWLASAACALGLWLLAAAGPQPPRVSGALLGTFVALVVWAALSHGNVRPELVMLAAGVGLVLLAVGFARDAQIARALQAAFVASAAISAVIGLCQYFGVAASFSPWMNAAEAGEAYANLRQPNQYATLCWIGAAVVLFGTLRLPRWAGIGLLVLLATGSAASVSRTGMVQGVVLTVLAAIWQGPQRRERLALCAVAALAYYTATVALPLLLDAWTGAMPARTLWGRLGGGQPCSSRLVLWSNVLHLIAHKPLAGWGWGELDYAHFDTLYAGPRFCDILDNAHNLPLHIAVELGVPAALLACGGALWWAWRQRPWGEEEPLRQLAWSLVALILLHSLLEYPLWYGPFQIALGAGLGWLARDRAHAGAVHSWRAAAVGAAVILLAATGYGAWDYARVSQIYLPAEARHARWRDDTLSHVRRSWLFSGQAEFAELTLATPARANAQWMNEASRRVLHYSPEPRVIERAIESATYLGNDGDAVLLLARYRAAFPREYEAWRKAQRVPLQFSR